MKCSFLLMTGALLTATVLTAADLTDSFDTLKWGNWTGKEGKVAYRLNATEKCAEMVFQEGQVAKVSGNFLRIFPVKTGECYRVSVKARCATEGAKCQAGIGVQGFVGVQNYHSTIINAAKKELNQDWKQLSVDFMVSDIPDHVQVLLSAVADSPATVQFDEFSLSPIDFSKSFTDSFDTLSWGFWKHKDAKIVKLHDPVGGRDGQEAALIEVQDGNPKGNSGCLTRHFPVEKGREYTLVVYVKSEGLAPDTKIAMSIQGQSIKPTKFLGTGVQGTKIKAEDCREWKRMVFTYQIPTTGKWQECGQILVTLGTGGVVPGKVWFDDFEFFRADAE